MVGPQVGEDSLRHNSVATKATSPHSIVGIEAQEVVHAMQEGGERRRGGGARIARKRMCVNELMCT